MSRSRVDEVLRFLGIEDAALLDELRREGLFPADELEPEEAEELRVAVTLVRELGVNAAGVEVALRMRRRLIVLERRVSATLHHVLDE